MIMYKIINVKGYESILIKGTNNSIHGRIGIRYEKFLQDVKEQGIGIVEGPDIIEDSYVELRKKEYPPLTDQLDKMYHDFDGWKNDIETIKNKYPKSITGGTSIGAIPDWIQTEVDNLNS